MQIMEQKVRDLIQLTRVYRPDRSITPDNTTALVGRGQHNIFRACCIPTLARRTKR